MDSTAAAGQDSEPPLPESGYAFEAGEREWVEHAGIENLKMRRESAVKLAAEANTTLTVLLAGLGASLAYAIKLLDGDFSLSAVAAFGTCVWLTYVATRLVQRCLKIRDISSVYNQPGRLLRRIKSGDTFAEWRYGELLNIEDRIQTIRQRNAAMADALNTARLLATATPVVAVGTVVLFIAAGP